MGNITIFGIIASIVGTLIKKSEVFKVVFLQIQLEAYFDKQKGGAICIVVFVVSLVFFWMGQGISRYCFSS